VDHQGSIAIAHEALVQRGGGERVAVSFARIFPGAPVYTSVFEAEATYREFSATRVVTSSLQRIPLFRRHHRIALPFMPHAWSHLQVEEPVVICSSSGWAHGVGGAARKIGYIHNTARWIYQLDEYAQRRSVQSVAARAMRRHLRRWDLAAAASLEILVANSENVRERIQRHWNRDAIVVYPPVSMDPSARLDSVLDLTPGFILTVSRLMSYKNVDRLLEMMRSTSLHRHRLVVAGAGPELERLQLDSPDNVMFVTDPSDAQLRWLYANCELYVAASYEDLGLTPIEAGLFGAPVVALRAGGYLETVREGETGLFFDNLEPTTMSGAVIDAIATRWDHAKIRDHAAGFSEDRFASQFLAAAGLDT
jgi:glycosyltransferase involved in cell wall biosynthesis